MFSFGQKVNKVCLEGLKLLFVAICLNILGQLVWDKMLKWVSVCLLFQAVGRTAGPPSECQAERGHPGHYHTHLHLSSPNPHHWALWYRQDLHPGTGCQTHSSPGQQQVQISPLFFLACIGIPSLICKTFDQCWYFTGKSRFSCIIN